MGDQILKDRLVFINGGDDGIGAELTDALTRAGAKVTVSSGDSPAGELTGMIEELGRVDVLINNVDLATGSPVESMTADSWHKTLTANLKPVFECCRTAASAMAPAGYGRIVNIGRLDYLGLPGRADYCAAKSALLGLTRSLALELAGRGVTVNLIALGDMEGGEAGQDGEQAASLAKSIPVQRLGRPADAVLAATYFASEEAAYTTGQTLFVCGGKSVYFSLSV